MMTINQQWVQEQPDTKPTSGQDTMDDVVQAITVDGSGNLYAVGYRTTANAAKRRAWIGRYDARSGQFTELRLLKKNTKDVEASAITLGSNNRLYVAGTFDDGLGSESLTKDEWSRVRDQDGNSFLASTSLLNTSKQTVKKYVWVAEYSLETMVTSPIQTEPHNVIQQNWMVVLNYEGVRTVKDIVTDGTHVYLTGSTNALATQVPTKVLAATPVTSWIAKVNARKLDWLDEPHGIPDTVTQSEGFKVKLSRDGTLEVFGKKEKEAEKPFWVAQYGRTHSTLKSERTIIDANTRLFLSVDSITDVATDGWNIYIAGRTTKSTLSGVSSTGGKSSPWPYVARFNAKGTERLWETRIDRTLGDNGPFLALYGNELYVTGENSRIVQIVDQPPNLVPSAVPVWVANYNSFTGKQRWLKDVMSSASASLNGDAYAIAASGLGVYVAGCVSEKKKGLVAKLGDTFNIILSYIRTAPSADEAANGAAVGRNLTAISGFIKSSSGSTR